jgi:hypothetical protein
MAYDTLYSYIYLNQSRNTLNSTRTWAGKKFCVEHSISALYDVTCTKHEPLLKRKTFFQK